MNEETSMYEFVTTADPGTLIEYGVVCGLEPYQTSLCDVAAAAAFNGHSMMADPCDPDCETGR